MVILPSGRSRSFNAGDEIIELRHMRKHIVADDEIRLTSLAHQLAGHPLTEKLDQSRHADFFSCGSHRVGRINAEHGYAHS